MAGKYTYDSCIYTYKFLLQKPSANASKPPPDDHHTRLAVGMTTLGVALTVDNVVFGSALSTLVAKGFFLGVGKSIADGHINSQAKDAEKNDASDLNKKQ